MNFRVRQSISRKDAWKGIVLLISICFIVAACWHATSNTVREVRPSTTAPIEELALRAILKEMPDHPFVIFLDGGSVERTARLLNQITIERVKIKDASQARIMDGDVVDDVTAMRTAIIGIREPEYSGSHVFVSASFRYGVRNGKTLRLNFEKGIHGWACSGVQVESVF